LIPVAKDIRRAKMFQFFGHTVDDRA